MQDLPHKHSVHVNEVMFTQEEVNDIVRKRLIRAQRHFEREAKQNQLHIEVMMRLDQEKIPIQFTTFIMSKDPLKTRKALETFTAMWKETKS